MCIYNIKRNLNRWINKNYVILSIKIEKKKKSFHLIIYLNKRHRLTKECYFFLSYGSRFENSSTKKITENKRSNFFFS